MVHSPKSKCCIRFPFAETRPLLVLSIGSCSSIRVATRSSCWRREMGALSRFEMPLPALRKKARCMAFCGTGGGMSLLNTYPKTALGLYKVSFICCSYICSQRPSLDQR